MMAGPVRAAEVMGNSMKLEVLLPALQAIVPRLSNIHHKGEGADLAHVFCSKAAATVIKSYSPELIVHPTLEESHLLSKISETVKEEAKQVVIKEVQKWLPRFNCLVIGPGLGRDPLILDCVSAIINTAKQENIPMVIDGDALFLITNSPELVCGYPLAILTPNVNEYKRLVAKIMGPDYHVPDNKDDISSNDVLELPRALAKRMGGLTIVRKGEKDIISDGDVVLVSGYFGAPRRCGGQGDVLSGCMDELFPL